MGLKEVFHAVRGRKLLDEPMARHTSLGVGGPADLFICPEDEADLAVAIRTANEAGVPIFLLGMGTNLLVLDGGIRGAVISTKDGLRNFWPIGGSELEKRGASGSNGFGFEAAFYVEAGFSLNSLARYTAANSFSGLEPCHGIPGSLGGALKMNAGTRGGAIGDVVLKVKLMAQDGRVRFLDKRQIDFGYRRSGLPDGEVVVGALIGLFRDEPSAIAKRMEGNRQRRINTQPLNSMSAGCAFKNEPEFSSGALIELMGFKGHRHGGATVSTLHANFIVNEGNARASDILAIIEKIEEKAERLYGICLKREIVMIGEP